MWRKSLICLASIVALGAAAHAAEADAHAPAKPNCLSASETREEKAEALSAKLCRLGEDYLYVISLLHRDGRYVHVEMDAGTGKWIEARRPRDAAAKP
jgi:hypothetical protein